MGQVQVVFFDIGDTLVSKRTRDWMPGAQDLIDALKELGVRVGVLSDTGGLKRDDQQLRELLPTDFRFDDFDPALVLLSGEVGVDKSSAEAFELAVHEAQVGAAQCLFVTEDLGHTIIAQGAGMRAVRQLPADGLGDLLGWLLEAGLVPRHRAATSVDTGPDGAFQISHETPVVTSALVRSGGLESAAAATPRSVADAYLQDLGPRVGLSAGAGLEANDDGPSLSFKSEKSVCGTVVVAYDQQYKGLPIFATSVAVRMQQDSLAVTSSAGQLCERVAVEIPAQHEEVEPAQLQQSLGIDGAPTIYAQQQMLYRYRAGERTEAPHGGHSLPELPLPAVPAEIAEDGYRHVCLVLFSWALDDWGDVNWKGLVDSKTRAVLYLRPNVTAATGMVYATDPPTSSGQALNAHSDENVLNSFRREIELDNLDPPASDGRQHLRGRYVRLLDTDPVTVAPPTEHEPFRFTYSAKTNDFAAVNAYYQCDRLYRLMEDLGFDVSSYFDGTSFPVPVDHRGESGGRNARANGNATFSGMGRYTFGLLQTGGAVGMACSPRVVLHEFGHAVLWDHVGSPNYGFAHSPGDALGAILFDPENNLSDRYATFPWAGLTSRRHDRKPSDGWSWAGGVNYDTQYLGEQVLSSTLFRAYQALGGDAQSLDERRFASRYMLFVILGGVGLLTAQTTDPRVYVRAMIDADRNRGDFAGQPTGRVGKVLRWAFEKQGLFGGTPPRTDVYIDDSQGGEYGFREVTNQSSGIWNRHAADGGQDHQAPIANQPNHLYVRVGNRGTHFAFSVRAHLYQKQADSDVWPTGWIPITAQTAGPGVHLRSGRQVVLGPYTWTPGNEATDILAVATASGDASYATAGGADEPVRRLVRWDNNVDLRRVGPS